MGCIASQRDQPAVVVPGVLGQARVPVHVARPVDLVVVLGQPLVGLADGVGVELRFLLGLAQALAHAHDGRLGLLLLGAAPPRDVKGEAPALGPVALGRVQQQQHRHHVVRVRDDAGDGVERPQVQGALPRKGRVDEDGVEPQLLELGGLGAHEVPPHRRVAPVGADDEARALRGAVGVVRRRTPRPFVVVVREGFQPLAEAHVDALGQQGPQPRPQEPVDLGELQVVDDLAGRAVEDAERVLVGRVHVGVALDRLDARPFLGAHQVGEDGCRPLVVMISFTCMCVYEKVSITYMACNAPVAIILSPQLASSFNDLARDSGLYRTTSTSVSWMGILGHLIPS